ncbi:hypothetical protein QYF61_006955 [Mycteria americana]|uniref:Maestro-like HEAT-repeats domain-containing protein n=1 Tax=Mycteria americana TaxID=33587 RepID=A0AAN7M9W8_MYCAM|nr:hypothetical protein QYF61_006955 [Mycteria americana]
MLCPTNASVFPLHLGDTLPEETPEHPELQLGWDSESTWLLSSCDSSDTTTVMSSPLAGTLDHGIGRRLVCAKGPRISGVGLTGMASLFLVFGEYLQPSQMTDVLLVAIQALTADDIYDRQMGSNVLDMAMRDPPSWLTDVSALWLDCPAREPCQALFFPPSLTPLSGAPEAISGQQRGMGRAAVSVAAWAMAALQWQHPPHPCPLQVPKIMRSIHINVERIRTEPARHSLVALLLLLTKRCPREAVRSLLKISPTCDRYWPRQP